MKPYAALTIKDLADSELCPCSSCSSQNLKKEGDDDFEVSDDLDSQGKKDYMAEILGQELPNIIEDLTIKDN